MKRGVGGEGQGGGRLSSERGNHWSTMGLLDCLFFDVCVSSITSIQIWSLRDIYYNMCFRCFFFLGFGKTKIRILGGYLAAQTLFMNTSRSGIGWKGICQ